MLFRSLVSLAAGDYIELYWSTTNTSIQLVTTTPSLGPRSPAVIVTVTPVTSMVVPTTVTNLTATGTISAQNFIAAVLTVVTAAGTTTLTVSSPHYIILTGTSTQTVTMPNATTLTVGQDYLINNNSTGTVTVKDFTGTTLYTVLGGASINVIVTSVGSSAGTWDSHGLIPSNVSWSNSGIKFPDTTVQTTAWTGSVSSLVNGSFTASLTSVGQLQLPVITQSTFTGGTLVATGNILMNANGNVWQFGSDGTMTSPYSVGITTTGFKIPATGGSVTLNAATSNGAYTISFPPKNGTVLTTADNIYIGTTLISLSRLSGTQTLTGVSIDGLAAQATAATTAVTLATPRSINGVLFDGSTNIVVPAAAGTLTGTTLNSTVVTSSLTSVGTLGQTNFSFSGSGTGAVLQVSGTNTQGGATYADFLKVTNTTAGATNPSKYFRIDNAGKVEIINNAYTSSLWSVTDAGVMSTGQVQINGKKAVNGPAFRAYVATGQTISSGSQQKVTFGSTTFDTDSCFSTVNSRFTPTVEGYYQFNATVRISGGSGTGEVMIVLYKNGSEYARGTNKAGTEQGASFYSLEVSDIAYANGSTDYFEIYFQQTSGSNQTTTAGSTISHFSAVMVRGN